MQKSNLGNKKRMLKMESKHALSRQKNVFELPTSKLDILKTDPPGPEDVLAWAAATSYNAAINDLSKIECYICGGPGHFMEICPMHEDLSDRFGRHGLRKAIYGRAINLMAESQNKV